MDAGGKKNQTTQTTSVGMGVVVGAGQLFRPPILIRDNMYLLKQVNLSMVKSLSDTDSDWLISAYSRGSRVKK